MTIVTIRDGVIVADTALNDNGHCVGRTQKVFAVPDQWGGGWVAGSGNKSATETAIQALIADGPSAKPSVEMNLLWLRADGSIWANDGGPWFELDAPFHAIGSGLPVALGAMAHGATAEEAARIACQIAEGCREPLVVRSVVRADQSAAA
jgi:hypothetical protein